MRFNFLLLCSPLLWSMSVLAQENSEFVLVKKEGVVSIYERWITFPKSNPPVEAREVKGEFTFNNSIYAALHLLRNEDKIEQWQSHVSEFKVYLRADTTTWLEYSYHDIPWPVSDQDHLLAYKLSVRRPGELFLTFESVADATLAPVRKGVSRMQLSGSWTLEQLSPSKAKATYRILSMPGHLPKFITDPVIRNNMMTTIEEFMALMEQKK